MNSTKALISGLSLWLLLAGMANAGDAVGAPSSGSVSETKKVSVQAPRELKAKGPEGELAGTLLSPDRAGAPVVLILPGSGPTDRDGNNPIGIKAATYQWLAQGLAERGIATVRIDKRGMFGSRQAFSRPESVTVETYADDVHSWITTIRQETGASCVWLLGHSEGGLIGLNAARRDSRHVCGLILLAAMGRPAGDVLREQLKANPANASLLPSAEHAISELEAGRTVPESALAPTLRPVFRPAVQGFLISVFKIDPAKELAALDKPVMIVQGEKDLQITVADAKRLHEAAKGSKLLLLPQANHVFKDVEGDNRLQNMMAYQDRSLPLSPGLVDGVAGFVEGAR